MAKLGDVVFKGAVSVLATVSLLGLASVSLSMWERFGMHRVSRGGGSLAAAARWRRAAAAGQAGSESCARLYGATLASCMVNLNTPADPCSPNADQQGAD